MQNRKRRARKSIIKALYDSHGVLVKSADVLDISSVTLRRWINEDPVLMEGWQRSLTHIANVADQKLFEAVENGEPWAIRTVINAKNSKSMFKEKPAGIEINNNPNNAHISTETAIAVIRERHRLNMIEQNKKSSAGTTDIDEL